MEQAMTSRGSGFCPSDFVREQTHPLPRGGTDLIAFEPSLSKQQTNGTIFAITAAMSPFGLRNQLGQ
jgi:hypothetical protein